MNFAELNTRKRAGQALRADELQALARGLASGAMGDAQAGAFAMAVCLRGMDVAETAALTAAMRDSGRVLHWPQLGVDRPVLDKHSTGGVGDCVSLVLAPLLAACGAAVPMLSGRGLGHTGGTLDKLEALPGLSTELDLGSFARCVRECGLAIVSASNELAPADHRLYAIRDCSGTVDSLPLITSSILSKKLAAGVDTLLLDLKLGSGALLRSRTDAEALAELLLAVSAQLGLRTEIACTDMDQPLANAAGNALEVLAAARVLRGDDSHSRLYRLSLALSARLLHSSGLCVDAADAHLRARRALASGAAAERFERMVVAMGGPPDSVRRAESVLPAAPHQACLHAAQDGWIGRIDSRALGEICVDLGAGRRQVGAAINPAVGLSDILEVSRAVVAGQPLLQVHAADASALQRALRQLASAFRIDATAPPPQPLVYSVQSSATGVDATGSTHCERSAGAAA